MTKYYFICSCGCNEQVILENGQYMKIPVGGKFYIEKHCKEKVTDDNLLVRFDKNIIIKHSFTLC